MANSSSPLDLLSFAVSQKEPIANALFNAASPAMVFARRASTCAGLTWGYYGGVVSVAGVLQSIASGTILLTPSTVNYLQFDGVTGEITVNTVGFGETALYAITTGETTVESYVDWRTGSVGGGGLSDGDKGDIIASGGGASLTIDPTVLTAFGRTLADDIDAAEAQVTLGLVPGTNIQEYSDELEAIAGLISAANKGIQFTGAGTAATFDLTAAGKALLDDADASAQRTTLGLGAAALLGTDIDGTLAANSDAVLPTQKAVKAYVDALVTGGATDVMIFKGGIDCSTNPNYPAAEAGNLYKVTVAGKIGGAAGPNVEAGDTIWCTTDGTASGTHAAVGANWGISQVNTDGVVIGPATSVDNRVALFSGTTGKLLKESTITAMLDMLGAMARGDILYRDATGWVRLAAGTAGQVLRTGGAGADPTWSSPPFDLTVFYPSVPIGSAILIRAPIARSVTFPANFAGCYANASINATAETVLEIMKNGALIGTITFAAGSSNGVFASVGGTSKSFVAGDIISVLNDSVPDATLADISFVLAGTR